MIAVSQHIQLTYIYSYHQLQREPLIIMHALSLQVCETHASMKVLNIKMQVCLGPSINVESGKYNMMHILPSYKICVCKKY